ncbi:hypothetical protein B0H13DRAFT_1868055 [Mycena leptocephala]|nr:hypothetical protein B0H13DRAFT_1868055 [Mycena leptocephala]
MNERNAASHSFGCGMPGFSCGHLDSVNTPRQKTPVHARSGTYPLRYVAGPKSASFFFGSARQMTNDPNLNTRWRKEFGGTFRFKGLFGMRHLHTSDLKALSHIMNNGVVHQRTPWSRDVRKGMVGDGVMSVGLEDHRRQASSSSHFALEKQMLISQAFGAAQIRLLTQIFVHSAALSHLSATSGPPNSPWQKEKMRKPPPALERSDILAWLRHCMLDIIGQACALTSPLSFTFPPHRDSRRVPL